MALNHKDDSLTCPGIPDCDCEGEGMYRSRSSDFEITLNIKCNIICFMYYHVISFITFASSLFNLCSCCGVVIVIV